MAINQAAVTRDIMATTLERYGSKLVANLPRMSPLFKWIDKHNRMTDEGFAGRVFRQPLEYGLNTNVMWYHRAEMLRIDEVESMAHADFYIRQFAGSVPMVGLDEIMNDGKQAQINYYAAKLKTLEKSFQYMLAKAGYYDGTEHGGKGFGGLRQAIVDNPALGRLGGLDRATEVDQDGRFWWRNQKIDRGNALDVPAVAAGKAEVRPMTRAYNRMGVKINNGADKVDMGLADANHFIDFVEEFQEKQYFKDEKDAGMGFSNVKHLLLDCAIINDPVMTETGGAALANHTFLLNSEYIHMKKAKGRWMTKLPSARNPQQDVSTEVTVGAGNMTYSNLERQGVVFN
jgi:hypothetical protein